MRSKISKNIIENDRIIFLNPDINHPEWIIKRGKINKDDEIKIYKIFETFLDDLSKFYNKKITVCIHPYNNIDRIRGLFKKYEVLQFQTVKNIRRAELVVFADLSSIVDAIILEKKLYVLKN